MKYYYFVRYKLRFSPYESAEVLGCNKKHTAISDFIEEIFGQTDMVDIISLSYLYSEEEDELA